MQSTATKFYESFSRLDWQSMNSCYADDCSFSDPIFQNLNAKEAKAMWKMLCTTAKDFSLTFEIGEKDKDSIVVNWQAKYTFSKTGRRVTNQVHTKLKIRDGKISEHIDQFDLYKWARQALGTAGFLFGWAPPFQAKVQENACSSLQKFLK